MKIIGLYSFLLLILVYGCSSIPEYKISVNSFARNDSDVKRKYVLRSGDKDVPESDLQFLEFQDYIRRGLNSRGLTYTEKMEDADLVILVNYGIGEPQTHSYTYSAPVWGQTGYSSATTVGTFSNYGSSGSYSANTTLNPTYGVTGYAPQTETVTTFSRWLSVAAYDAQALSKDKKMEQVWKSNIVSTGTSGDLRKVMPAMVVASWPYWAKNTGEMVNLSIEEDNPSILALRENKKEKDDAK